ncbi:S-adenosyl-L-methionine-dependent methyltransferase [Lecanosticta acicola]|uniref:DNA (cytosine-5-)-methyltransferase n=1 Tax=Lecanosticta acicola TaxID=111012 RepID=A0AAI8Z542_9PEZI|nr:S-adenosyl-L-methionine-dependent methyltransferase [Lecanosticta acicola]
MARQSSLPFPLRKSSPTPRPPKRKLDVRDAVDEFEFNQEDLPPAYILSDSSDELDDDQDDRDDEETDEPNEEQDEIRRLRTRLASTSLSGTPTGYQRLASATTASGLEVRPGMNVELQDADFLRIHDILQDVYGKIIVRGMLLRRTRWMNNWLPKKLNELCAQFEIECDDINDLSDSMLVIRPLDLVIQARKIVFTNKDFPAHSYRDFLVHGYREYANDLEREDRAVLVCRWKLVVLKRDRKGRVPSARLTLLGEHESDADAKISDEAKRCRFGRHADKVPEVDLTNEICYRPNKKSRGPIRTGGSPVHTVGSSPDEYTYGDFFAGAGGCSRGAALAGLRVNFVVDHDGDACRTLEENFPEAKVMKEEIFTFLAMTEPQPFMHVDVLHISPPCQPHSAAHTVDGKNDAANIAAGYVVLDAVKKCRPRIVTVEQTEGIFSRHHDRWANLIHQFTWAGYSISWRVSCFNEWDYVHKRKRLLLMAACPGQPLPRSPEPTHGPGLKPYVTVADRLNLLPPARRIPAHMLKYGKGKGGGPYDPNKPLKACITTSGGDGNTHPGGGGSFNGAELAVLAGFPPWPHHKFAPACMTSIFRQCGNAVASTVMKLHFKECLKTLKKTDGIEETEAQSVEDGEVIVLDDDREVIVLDDEDGKTADTAWVVD